jgi:predicted dehydrogenase
VPPRAGPTTNGLVTGRSDALRAGLIGFGLAGQVFHAPLIEATPDLSVAAIVTSDHGRQQAARARYPDATVHSTAEQLFAAGGLDLVVVATPNRFHGPLARRAIEAGIATVVDKPFTPTAAEGGELVALAAHHGVVLSVFQNRRWDGDFLTLRGVLDRGDLGTVHRFESRFERWRPQAGTSWRDRGERDEAGGILFDLQSHLIDQAVVLFGPVASVYAEVDRRRPDAAIDDDVFLALQHTGGVVSHLWTSVLAAQKGPRFRVLGDRGAFTTFGLDPQEEQSRAGMVPGDAGWGVDAEARVASVGVDDDLRPIPLVAGSYERYYAELAAALRGAGPVPVDPADAVATIALIETALEQATG